MKTPSDRNVIVYHARCADGATAAWAAYKYLTKLRTPEIDLIAHNYSWKLPSTDKFSGADVYIVDYSFPRDYLLEINEIANSLVVLDHHKTAQERLGGLPFAVFDMERSGAEITWDWFHGDEPRPGVVRYVGDKDLWKFELPDSKAINAYFATQFEASGFSVSTVDRLDLLMRRTPEVVKQHGALYLDQTLIRANDRAEHAYPASIQGVSFMAANACSDQSETGNAIIDKYGLPSCTWFYEHASGMYIHSLRSREGLPDVGEIAKAMGGGGHRNAAGFSLADHIKPDSNA